MTETPTIKTCSCEAYKLIIAEKDTEIERLRAENKKLQSENDQIHAGWHEGYRDGLDRKHLENSEAEIMRKEIDDLNVIRNIADELVGLTSYAEIVGGVTVNRDPIRKLCDEFIKLNRPFKERAISEILGDAPGEEDLKDLEATK